MKLKENKLFNSEVCIFSSLFLRDSFCIMRGVDGDYMLLSLSPHLEKSASGLYMIQYNSFHITTIPFARKKLTRLKRCRPTL
jgi:hypothetical protein